MRLPQDLGFGMSLEQAHSDVFIVAESAAEADSILQGSTIR